MSQPSRLIVSADDFGLSEAVNEGIERAYREGCLSTASLMVTGAAAADAVARARRNPGLRVGLHLVVVEGEPALPASSLPRLLDRSGRFGSDQATRGVRYFLDPRARHELAAEIDAQFDAFARTGLTLDHANAHKHMHLHPTVGGLLIASGMRRGLRAVRVPTEPASVLAACGVPTTWPSRVLAAWTGWLRTAVRRAGMVTSDHCFGLAWSGGMTAARVMRLLDRLPAGTSEIYFHPAAGRDPVLDHFMPTYDHEGELAALTDPEWCARVRPLAADWGRLA